jgi:hypothetical protein
VIVPAGRLARCLTVALAMIVVAACSGSDPGGKVSPRAQAAPIPAPEASVEPAPESPSSAARDAGLLPPAVFDQWADPRVRVINMPAGTYYLSGRLPLRLRRSNVTVNFAGATLIVDPVAFNGGSYPIQVQSTPRSEPKYRSSGPGDPRDRTLSHITGRIDETTTELTMVPGERVDLAPGEQVMIHAGVSASDPFESQDYIVATVAAVNAAGTITFKSPLGKRIIDYGDAAGLRAVVAQGQAGKIGEWGSYPDASNFSKGYGTDHGLERFAGPIVHDVTFNDLHLVLNKPGRDSSAIPGTMWEVSAIAVQNFKMNRTTIENPRGSGVHLWRAFNTVIDGYKVVGAGLAKIWNTSTYASPAISIWGGDGVTVRNMSVTGTNITAFSSEIGPRHVWIDGLDYKVEFTKARDYGTADVILGFFSVQGPVRLTNVSLEATTTGGAAHTYFSYAPFVSDGYLRFPGSGLTSTFDFGYQMKVMLNGTVSIDGVTYGPPVSEVRRIELKSGSPRLALPRGLYTAASLRVLNRGDIRNIWDSFGNRYTPEAFSGRPVTLASDKWMQIEPGVGTLKTYLEKTLEFDHPAGASVELSVTYLPAVADSRSNQNSH